jgi:hypothetical protein
MKRYTISFAAALKHKPEHPERTAKRCSGRVMDFDVTYQVWPNRASMARTIRMQERSEHRPDNWRACVPLAQGEGY